MNKTWMHTLWLAALVVVTAPAHAGWSFVFTLDGFQETPPVVTDATGSCVAILSDDESELTVNCHHDVENVVAAHIHQEAPGFPGGIVLPFDDPTSPITQSFDITPDIAANLLAGNLYVNVHSTAHPGGEVRGQMRVEPPVDAVITEFVLEGAQEVPPVATDRKGRCLLALNAERTVLHLDCVHEVDDAIAAHIHQEERGVNGGIVVPLGDPSSPIRHTVDLTAPGGADLLAALEAGELYVNVHSPAHAGGEIRGQIDFCVNSATSLCLQDNRFRVEVDFATLTETGAAHAVPQQANSGMFWFFTPDNLELLIKILDGCAINDYFWVFFAPTTNVEFTITVTDTETGVVQTYENEQGTIAQPQLDVTAFDTCP